MSCTLRIELEETKGTKANGVRLALGGETLDGTVFITRCPEKKDIEVEGEDVSYLLEVSLDGEHGLPLKHAQRENTRTLINGTQASCRM